MTDIDKLKAVAATNRYNIWLNYFAHLKYWDVNIGVIREMDIDLEAALERAVEAVEKRHVNDPSQA